MPAARLEARVPLRSSRTPAHQLRILAHGKSRLPVGHRGNIGATPRQRRRLLDDARQAPVEGHSVFRAQLRAYAGGTRHEALRSGPGGGCRALPRRLAGRRAVQAVPTGCDLSLPDHQRRQPALLSRSCRGQAGSRNLRTPAGNTAHGRRLAMQQVQLREGSGNRVFQSGPDADSAGRVPRRRPGE